MGVDVVAIAEHNLDSLEQAPELLKLCDGVFLKHINVLKKWDYNHKQWHFLFKPPLNWTWQKGTEFKYADLNGPLGFSIWFCPKNLYTIHPTPRWGALIDEPKLFEAVNNVCESIVKVLGGNKIIYVPDSAYCSSNAFNEYSESDSMQKIYDVEAYLRKECSPPFESLTSIRKEFSDAEIYEKYPDWNGSKDSRAFEVDGYYISNF